MSKRKKPSKSAMAKFHDDFRLAQRIRRAAGRDAVFVPRRLNIRTSGYAGRYTGPNAELKFLDVNIASATVAAAGSIVNSGTLLVVAQGTGESGRVGRKITIRKASMRAIVALPATSLPADTGDLVRVILYCDKQCNGATAAVTDILESTDILAFNNLANKGRFRTLLDKTVALNSQGGSWDGTNDQYASYRTSWSKYLDLNIPIEYDNTTGVISEIRSNNIGCLVISHAGRATIELQFRFRYSDL
jgi:hypothetical protein